MKINAEHRNSNTHKEHSVNYRDLVWFLDVAELLQDMATQYSLNCFKLFDSLVKYVQNIHVNKCSIKCINLSLLSPLGCITRNVYAGVFVLLLNWKWLFFPWMRCQWKYFDNQVGRLSGRATLVCFPVHSLRHLLKSEKYTFARAILLIRLRALGNF